MPGDGTVNDESGLQQLPKPSALLIENWFEEFRRSK
jgi:hypothetical protein